MTVSIYRGVAIRLLQAALVVGFATGVWLIYRGLPLSANPPPTDAGSTTLQIAIEQPLDTEGVALDVEVRIFPVDLVAVNHEFFSEPSVGKRYDDFLKERMKGKAPIITHLDKQGRGSVKLAPGNWWLHAKVTGDEELEWRLPLTVSGPNQSLQLNSQNAYTRSKTF
jgi:hypothetical protein